MQRGARGIQSAGAALCRALRLHGDPMRSEAALQLRRDSDVRVLVPRLRTLMRGAIIVSSHSRRLPGANYRTFCLESVTKSQLAHSALGKMCVIKSGQVGDERFGAPQVETLLKGAKLATSLAWRSSRAKLAARLARSRQLSRTSPWRITSIGRGASRRWLGPHRQRFDRGRARGA